MARFVLDIQTRPSVEIISLNMDRAPFELRGLLSTSRSLAQHSAAGSEITRLGVA
jgi:hypothetical protein